MDGSPSRASIDRLDRPGASSIMFASIADPQLAYRTLLDHRLFEVEQSGWGLMVKACLGLQGRQASRFVLLDMTFAWQDGQPIGVVAVHWTSKAKHRLFGHSSFAAIEVYVKPSARGQGVGDRLLTRAHAHRLPDIYELYDFLKEHFPISVAHDRQIQEADDRSYRQCLRFLIRTCGNDHAFVDELNGLLAQSLRATQHAQRTHLLAPSLTFARRAPCGRLTT